MTPSTLEAFDTLSWSTLTLERLETAYAGLSKKQGLAEEKAWLSSALERVRTAREGVAGVDERAMRLPELEPLRDDYARVLQGAAIDAVERLLAGITFHAGSRAPLLEALTAKLKFPALRRAEREDFESFCADFEKRLGTSYAKRMFGEQVLAPVGSAIDAVRAAFATWRAAFAPAPLTDDEARALRDELEGLARRLELPLRQARLLAEAALAPVKNGFEESGLGQRPKRRTARAVVTESSVPAASEEAQASAVPAAPHPEPDTAPIAVPGAVAKPRRSRKGEPRDTP